MKPDLTHVHREETTEVTEERNITLSNGTWIAEIELENKHFRSIVIKTQGDISLDRSMPIYFGATEIYKLKDLSELLDAISQEILDILKERKENE